MMSESSFDITQESNPVQTVAQPKEDNEMLRATNRITALYCRLSVEDTKEDKKNGKEDLSNDLITKSTHKMRKTYASKLNANGVPLDAIRELLGHSELSTTLGYIYNPLTESETFDLIARSLY